MNRRLILTLACAAASTALAEGAICDTSGQCRYSELTRVLQGKLYFRNDQQKQTGRSLVRGDFVALRSVKDYGVCVLYISKAGREVAGWVDQAKLDPATSPRYSKSALDLDHGAKSGVYPRSESQAS